MAQKHSPEALRKARNARLAQTNSSAPSAEATQQPKSAAAETSARAEVPRELTARVANPANVGVDSKITCVGPYNTNTDNPHWVVFADGEPFAKVALADQQNPDSIRKIFATEDYAKSFLDTCKKAPLAQVLVATKARPYVAVVKSTEVFAAVESKYKAEAKAELQARAAGYRDQLATMVNLVVEAQRKNFLTDNPLKDSLFKQLKAAGVQNPVAVIENAFVEASGAHFESTMKQAQKWMDFTPEALADIKQAIMEMPVRTVSASVEMAQGARPPVPSSRGNVPVVASSVSNVKVAEVSDKEAARQQFSFRDRMKGNLMPQNG